MIQYLKKFENREFLIFFAFQGKKCRVEANNNHFVVLVCVRHVAKRSSKRSALVFNKLYLLVSYVSHLINYQEHWVKKKGIELKLSCINTFYMK